MLNKYKKIIAVMMILSLIVGYLLFLYNTCSLVDDKKEQVSAERLVITVPEKMNDGILTIVDDETGEEVYETTGTFDIINDGHDGNRVAVRVHIPSTRTKY